MGKQINQARINFIPKTSYPLVFVMSENKYAIRNLKIFGFIECAIVNNMTIFNSYKRQQIKLIIKNNNIVDRIIKGIEKGSINND